jgi:hypothetical protein
MYVYFFTGFLFGSSILAFLLVKEIYLQNKKITVQANQIERLEKLNQMLAVQISEERVYGQVKEVSNVKS